MSCVWGLNWVHSYILCRCDPLPGDILWVWEGRGGTPLVWPGCNVRDAVLKCDCNLVTWSLFVCPEHRLRKRCVLIGRGYTVKTVKETEAGHVCSGSTPGSWVSGKPSFIVGVDTAVVCRPRAVTCVDFFSLDSYLQFSLLMMVWLSRGLNLQWSCWPEHARALWMVHFVVVGTQ